MTNPIKKAVDSLFCKLGQTATYKNKEVRILLTEPDEVVGIGFANTHSGTHQLKIRTSEAPKLKVGDKFIIGEDTFEVYTEPKKDIHKLIWSCDLKCC